MNCMNRSRREVIEFIQFCISCAEQGDDSTIEVTKHFRDRMLERGMFWADVVTILWDPLKIELRGIDNDGRQQVWVYGRLYNIGDVRITCTIDWDLRLITLHWD